MQMDLKIVAHKEREETEREAKKRKELEESQDKGKKKAPAGSKIYDLQCNFRERKSGRRGENGERGGIKSFRYGSSDASLLQMGNLTIAIY